MDVVLLLGAILLVGFIGRIVNTYTRIPESIFMLLIGLTLGPILRLVDPTAFVQYERLGVTATLVIMIIDNCLSLDVYRTTLTFNRAFQFTLLVLVLTTGFVGYFMYLAGWGLLPAVLLGVLSSGTTTLAAYTLLARLDVSDKVRQLMNMESVLNDSFIITCAIIVLQLIGIGTFDPHELVGALASPLLISLGLGVLFAVLWVQALWIIENVERWSYIFTLGLLFILYATVEAFNGNGGIAVLVAGLTLVILPATVRRFSTYPRDVTVQYGALRVNPTRLRRLQDRFDAVIDKVRNAQVNFAFIAENFFFVYFGILFDPTRLTTTLIGLSGVLVLLIFVSRYLSARVVGLIDREVRREAVTLSIVVARSSTAIVVALLPETMGIVIPLLKEMVLVMVLLSSLVTLIGLRLQERIGHGRAMVLQS